jgi:hypothetical protein
MTVTTNFFVRPVFRSHVGVELTDAGCVLRCRDQEYELEFDPECYSESARLLKLLQNGERTFDELTVELPALGPGVGELCRDLDRFGLITDAAFVPATAKSGTQFYRELDRFVERVKLKHNDHPLYQRLREGTATREELIGYVLEYYHIVLMCPGLLAPSLSHHESRTTKRILQDFFTSELDHDILIERALEAVGISRRQLDCLVPLPMTFSVCASLGVYARQHPLSFKACLFLFEQADGDFNTLFKARCDLLGLSEDFYGPVFEHAQINDEGDHDKISQVLYADVPCLSEEEQTVVKRHVAILIESLSLMEKQIVDYYGTPGSPIPRCFE